ncbi:hypothetical protein ACLB2K_011786 [Fragaria x ananassa]
MAMIKMVLKSAVSTDGRVLVSCGTDCSVRLWAVLVSTAMELDVPTDNSVKPLETYVWKNAFRSVDHQ